MAVSCVLIVPAALHAAGNALVAAIEGGGDEGADRFTVPLAPDGIGPATHFGLHGWVAPGFRAAIESGSLPAGLIASFRAEAEADDHVEAVLAAAGLAIVGEEGRL